MPLCKYAITNCHFYYDLLKMHKAFWGGAEISLVDTSTALSSEAQ